MSEEHQKKIYHPNKKLSPFTKKQELSPLLSMIAKALLLTLKITRKEALQEASISTSSLPTYEYSDC